MYEAKLEFPEGWGGGVIGQIPSVGGGGGGMDIFWNHTMFGICWVNITKFNTCLSQIKYNVKFHYSHPPPPTLRKKTEYSQLLFKTME